MGFISPLGLPVVCVILRRHQPILCCKLVYDEDYPFYAAARWDPHHGTPEQQRRAAEAKTAQDLAQLLARRIIDFESAKAALNDFGLTVERGPLGRIRVTRAPRQLGKPYRNEESFLPDAREILAQGYRRLKLFH